MMIGFIGTGAMGRPMVRNLVSSHGYGRKDVSSVYAFLAPSSADAPV